MKTRFLILASFLFCLHSHAQDLSTVRKLEINITSDTIRPDSLMILPGYLFLFDQQGKRIPDSLFSLEPSGREIIIDPFLRGKTLMLHYRVLAIDITRPYFNKDPVRVSQRSQDAAAPFRITSDDISSSSYYSYSELNKRGSLSRGITFGNNQDVVVNSNLNLQLTGRLSENLNIAAVISDNNIPIQPEGYSQQISEFDKVYIELFNEQMSLVAGDFELEGSPGDFMDFYKRAKGAVYSGDIKLGKNKKANLTSTVSGAISKGRYSRNSFNGIEGNQGPYKLGGSRQEQFIIVLAGSERVFIDGHLLTRGINNDYIIDYNSAEITFTPRHPITKDKRILVEFEYSERSYARFLVFTSNEIRTSQGKFWFNAFSEQDDKNQTLQQDLSDIDKILLSQIGNDLQAAVVPRIDSTGYDPDEVLYLKKDSLVNGTLIEDVYVHSIHPDSAFYRLRFSYVGEGNGNYVQVRSAANGKVFRWQAPANGVKRGTHEPVALLIPPGKKQVFSIGGVQQLSGLTRAAFEIALTNNDPNTYSGLDADQNLGYAVKASLDQDLLRRDTSRMRLQGSLHYRHTSAFFDPVERFRSVEYTRDWNLQDEEGVKEHLAELGLKFFSHKAGRMEAGSELLTRNNGFEGIRNNLNGNLHLGGFEISMNGSLMNSRGPGLKTQFFRHRISLERHLPFMVIGAREEGENNRWNNNMNDSLTGNSFAYQQFEVFISRPDSVQNQAHISYKSRRDFLPGENALRYATLGQDLSLGIGLLKNPGNRLNALFTVRDLSIHDTSFSIQKPERTILGRLEHGLQLAGGVISTSTFYEVGSGLETRKDYSYLEVPAGQGIYQWIDYNENGVRELDEFEIARFQDQARFIRILLPSADYFTVYTNQFNQTIHLDPARVWKNKEGFRGFASFFSDQFAYRVLRKSSIRDISAHLNPFSTSLNDPELITFTSSFRNNLSFNKSGRIFGANYIYQKNHNRSLLANGYDTRTLESHGFRGRFNPGKGVLISNEFDSGNKTNQSEFLDTRNYNIDFITNKVKVQYQLNMVFRIETTYGYRYQFNSIESQKSREHNLGAELRYSILDKGILTARMDYFHLDYNEDPDTPVAYEMLGSLLPGHNGTWTVLFRRSITGGIELNLEYAGRVSGKQEVIHTGGMQVRANF